MDPDNLNSYDRFILRLAQTINQEQNGQFGYKQELSRDTHVPEDHVTPHMNQHRHARHQMHMMADQAQAHREMLDRRAEHIRQLEDSGGDESSGGTSGPGGSGGGTASLGGTLVDGYIKNATGRMKNVMTGETVGAFTTNNAGKWSLRIPTDNIPEVYKIEFLPGGVDVLTGKVMNTTLSNVATKAQTVDVGSESINISPITTLKAGIVESKIESSGVEVEIDFDNIIEETVEFVAEAFSIDVEDLEVDYIGEGKGDVLKVSTKLALITETLKTVVVEADSTVTNDNIFSSLVEEFVTQEETGVAVNILNNDNKIKDIVVNSTEVEIAVDSPIVNNAQSLTTTVSQKVNEATGSDFTEIVTNVAKNVTASIEVISTVDLSVTIEDISDVQEQIEDDAAEVEVEVAQIFQSTEAQSQANSFYTTIAP